jgi:hypothetical protein
MSAPTRQLHRLSIGGDVDVPVMNSQAEEGSAAMNSSSGESRSGGDESAGLSTVQANSGIVYDLARLDGDSEARALVGLTSQFDVVGCRAIPAGYDFQLSERPRIHIGSDAYTCTCSTFSGHPEMACQHIFVSCTYLLPIRSNFNADP